MNAAVLDSELTDWRNTDESWSRWVGAGSTVPQQQAVRDFCAARSKALKDLRNKVPRSKRRGLPKFHSYRHTRPSLNYTTRGFTITDNRLVVAGGIAIPVVWSRTLPSAPSSVRINQDACGHWWASFVVRRDPPTGEAPEHTAIGIDWGVKAIATTTDDSYDLAHPQHGAASQQDLAKIQRRMARRRRPNNQPQSNGYIRARGDYARLCRKIARQRQDTAHKWSKQVVDNHQHIAVEDFKPKFLAKSTMARKAADAAIGDAKRLICERATRQNRDLRLVDPKYTTMDCSKCGARTKHRLPLSQRTFVCVSCGHTADRDKNAAATIAARAGFHPAGVESVRPETREIESRQLEPGIPRL